MLETQREEMAMELQVGQTVKILPMGKRNRITVLIDQIVDLGDGVTFVVGRRPSKKWPGDYVGTGGWMVRQDDR